MPDIVLASLQTHALNEWNRALVGPLSRTLAWGNPHLIGWEVLVEALGKGAWQVTGADLKDNALLALLLNQPFSGNDPITNPHHSGITPPPNEDLQALCLLLIEKGMSPTHAHVPLGHITALDLALVQNLHEVVKRHADPSWFNDRTINGLPWLHAAALAGCRETMEALLDKGVDPNIRAQDGSTALFHASSPDIVQVLRDRGADPALLDNANLDAFSYWRTRRNAVGDVLAEMKKSLGSVPVSSAAAVPQFLALLQKCTVSQMKKEVRRLKIKGDEWHEGKSIVSAFIDRLVQDMQSISLSDGPLLRIRHLADWKEALDQATPHELGLLAASAVVVGLHDTRKTFLDRIPKDQQESVMCNAWLDLVPRIALQQARQQSVAKSVFLWEASLSSKAKVLVALFGDGFSYPSSELLNHFTILKVPAADPGWSHPGFTSLLVNMATCATSLSAGGLHENLETKAQKHLRKFILDKASEGVDFSTGLEMGLPKAQKPEVAEFLDHLAAINAANRLSANTPVSAPRPRASRL